MNAKTVPVLALAAVWACAAGAQEPAPLENCVSLQRLDYTHVVDDQSILFYMNGKDVYLNALPNRCPTLQTEKRFLYRVTMNQLCHLDLITVIYDAGFGFMEGPSCRIGKFQPVSAEFANKLRAPKGAAADATEKSPDPAGD